MKFFLLLIFIGTCYCYNKDICDYCECYKQRVNCTSYSGNVASLIKTSPGRVDQTYLIVDKKPGFSLSNSMFWKFSKLTGIVITNCDISKIPRNTFRSQENLIVINLSMNKLKYIKRNVFSSAVNMQKLILAGNHLTTIPPLENSLLEELNFAGNQLTNLLIPEEIKRANIKKLIVSKNQITEISKTTFEPIASSLKTLKLSNNPIAVIEDGAFQLPNLEVLDISNTNLPPEMFCNLLKGIANNKFKSLKLKNTSLRSPIQDCPLPKYVGVLNLAHNTLEKKSIGQLLKPVKNYLRFLILDGCFQNFIDLHLPEMKSLKKLSLRDSVISTVPEDFWMPMPNLEELDLSGSEINHLATESFSELNKLKRLDLSKVTGFVFSLEMINGLPIQRLILSGTQVGEDANSCEKLKHIKYVKFSIHQNIPGCHIIKGEYCKCGGDPNYSDSGSSLSTIQNVLTSAGVIAIVMGGGFVTYKQRNKIRNLLSRRGVSHSTVHYSSPSNCLDNYEVENPPQIQEIEENTPLQERQVDHQINPTIAFHLPRQSGDMLNRYRNRPIPMIQMEPPVNEQDSFNDDNSILTESTNLRSVATVGSTDEENTLDNIVTHLSDYPSQMRRSTSSIDLDEVENQ